MNIHEGKGFTKKNQSPYIFQVISLFKSEYVLNINI